MNRNLRKLLSSKAVRAELEALLEARLSDAELLSQLEALSRESAFRGFTWLWGSTLYARNRVAFRTFINEHFASWAIQPENTFRNPFSAVRWTGEAGQRLEAWLAEADASDDVAMTAKLMAWQFMQEKTGLRERSLRLTERLCKRLERVREPAEQRAILRRFDFFFELNEASARLIFAHAPKVSGEFLLARIPSGFLRVRKKNAFWELLAKDFLEAGREDLYFALYRRQVSEERFLGDALELCRREASPESLNRMLIQRKPDPWNVCWANVLYALVDERGRDVLPFVFRNLNHLHSGIRLLGRNWGATYTRLLELARQKGLQDLEFALLRTCTDDTAFNAKILSVVQNIRDDAEARSVLASLAGVSREWNVPGMSLARVHLLNDSSALALYHRFPDVLRGPFRLHLQTRWNFELKGLLDCLLEKNEDPLLVDFLASRLITAHGSSSGVADALEKLTAHYKSLVAKEGFARRAASVLGQIPACAIYGYGRLIRENALARFLFQRIPDVALSDARSMADLIEAPEIHVQSLAYRLLASRDPRASAVAAENLDVILGTLLRPLHRKTRIYAFGALANAAIDEARACRILSRARDALLLPDKNYPKSHLLELVGILLHRWPQQASDRELPVVHPYTKLKRA